MVDIFNCDFEPCGYNTVEIFSNVKTVPRYAHVAVFVELCRDSRKIFISKNDEQQKHEMINN